jgi:hypothetical protein
MSVHAGEFRGCAITVTTEQYQDELFGPRHRVTSVTVTRDGEDLGYPLAIELKGKDEAELVELAARGARVYIANRFPP